MDEWPQKIVGCSIGLDVAPEEAYRAKGPARAIVVRRAPASGSLRYKRLVLEVQDPFPTPKDSGVSLLVELGTWVEPLISGKEVDARVDVISKNGGFWGVLHVRMRLLPDAPIDVSKRTLWLPPAPATPPRSDVFVRFDVNRPEEIEGWAVESFHSAEGIELPEDNFAEGDLVVADGGLYRVVARLVKRGDRWFANAFHETADLELPPDTASPFDAPGK